MKSKRLYAAFLAIAAAALYALNAPFSKLLLNKVSPTMLAGLLYLGAGIGMGVLLLFKAPPKNETLSKKDMPFTVAMVLLDILAPILLMFGMYYTTAANASLLNNFEIVATTVIAFCIFKEKVSPRLWVSILLVVAASAILGFEGREALTFNKGSLLVLGACVCWGVENNCTRSISHKSSKQIVFVKGIFSGLGSVITAFVIGEKLPEIKYLLFALLLGFVAYGLSIMLYVTAQKHIGAAKTGAFYSVAPFIAVGFSFVFLREQPAPQFYIALSVMAVSTALMVWDTLKSEQ